MGFGRRRRFEKKSADDVTELQVESRAMHILGVRDHAREELRKKLKQRGFPDVRIDPVLDRLEAAGYVDDERTSRVFVRALVRDQWGPMRIRQKMMVKGFDSDTIADALEEHDAEETWIESATARVRQKFRKEPEELEQDEKEKAFRHLTYRGYSGSVSRSVLFT
jgi:regulatory protein